MAAGKKTAKNKEGLFSFTPAPIEKRFKKIEETLKGVETSTKNIKNLEKAVSDLKDTFSKHERANREATNMLLGRIKKKRPVEVDELEEDVQELTKDRKLLHDLMRTLDKLGNDFIEFKANTDGEFEELITKVSSLDKDLSKRHDSLSKDFSKHQEKLDIVHKKIKQKLPPPPIAPGMEGRLESVEKDISEVMDIARSAKEVADSSRVFMDEAEDQLSAQSKLLEEHRAARLQAEANILDGIEKLKMNFEDLKMALDQLNNKLADTDSKVHDLLGLKSDLAMTKARINELKSKIDYFEQVGFGALVID